MEMQHSAPYGSTPVIGGANQEMQHSAPFRNPLKENPMEGMLTVYRIETPEGKGPFSGARGRVCSHAYSMPCPWNDGIVDDFSDDTRHGFHDPMDVCRWFGPDLPSLESHDFVLSVLTVPREFAYTGKQTSQTLFDVNKAIPVKRLPVNVIADGPQAFAS